MTFNFDEMILIQLTDPDYWSLTGYSRTHPGEGLAVTLTQGVGLYDDIGAAVIQFAYLAAETGNPLQRISLPWALTQGLPGTAHEAYRGPNPFQHPGRNQDECRAQAAFRLCFSSRAQLAIDLSRMDDSGASIRQFYERLDDALANEHFTGISAEDLSARFRPDMHHHYLLNDAIKKNNPETVDALLQRGCSPNADGPFYGYPLFLATLMDQPALVERLIEAGADPRIICPSLTYGPDSALAYARTHPALLVHPLIIAATAQRDAPETKAHVMPDAEPLPSPRGGAASARG